jgi:MerR family transcriptional regulator, mercuric resistance operon regulatory protein
MTESTGLRSGDVARAAGVNQQTLRYYERRGLLAEPLRTPGGHRVYPAGTVTLLRAIKAAQRLGFTLDEVADLLDVGARRRARGRAGLLGQAKTKLAEVESRIEDLQVIRTALQDAIDAGCDDLVECADSNSCPLPFVELATASRRPQ